MKPVIRKFTALQLTHNSDAFEHNPYGTWMIVPIVRFEMY